LQKSEGFRAKAPRVSRSNLLQSLGINCIPTAYRALFHHDPAVAILDAWAFSMQMANYFERGDGKEDFGQWYQIAHNSSLKFKKSLHNLLPAACRKETLIL
jgi:hypothetical protein